jgi:translation initiation factor 6 (eIF-6)
MLAKISAEVMKAIGAETAAEVDSQMSAFIAEANKNKASMAENKTTLESLQSSITALEGKLLTEDRVKALFTEQFNATGSKAISDFVGSEAGKKIIAGEASRVVMEAHAAIGTTPAKPAPVNPAAAETKTFAEIVQAGIASGKTKTEAIAAAVEAHPNEYQSYLKTGGKL